MTEAEQVMKRCQIGTRNYNEANNLHADCYRVIGKLLAERSMREVQRLGQEIETKIGCVNHDCDQCKAQPERHELQAKGEHPAPCARHCEANAFQIVIKNLKAQLAQRKPLTGAQISAIGSKIFPSTWNIRHLEFARAIEAAHGIKENT